MNISAVTSPYWLNTERVGNSKAVQGSGFSDVLEKEKAKEAAAEIAIMEMNSAREDIAGHIPSYTVTEEQAEYFREKYGEEYDEDNPYQLFYELAEKKIISHDDAVRSSGYGHLIMIPGEHSDYAGYSIKYLLEQGIAKESYSNKHGWCNSYYDRFMGKYNKEINTWQDVAQQEYDFWQYMIGLDERMVTPDGTYFQSSKEQMNVGFRKECEGILKVKDVLSQIFGEATL